MALLKYHHNYGFTLIEVLIALLILGIALVSIVKVTGDNIRNLNTLKERTIAHWLAIDTIKEKQLDLATPEETTIFGQTWYRTIHFTKTPNKNVQEITVIVKKEQDGDPINTMTGFIYDKK